jgi:hypothetical protein
LPKFQTQFSATKNIPKDAEQHGDSESAQKKKRESFLLTKTTEQVFAQILFSIFSQAMLPVLSFP